MTGRRVDSLTAAAEAADVLHAQGARNVIITLGASGALLSEHGVKSPIPCFPSHPRDTTGAGDAFNGALAARLACGEPLQAAARFARPMPPSVSKSKAPHLYLSTWRHRNGFSVPPLIMKWHKPYCIKNIKRIAQ